MVPVRLLVVWPAAWKVCRCRVSQAGVLATPTRQGTQNGPKAPRHWPHRLDSALPALETKLLIRSTPRAQLLEGAKTGRGVGD